MKAISSYMEAEGQTELVCVDQKELLQEGQMAMLVATIRSM